MKKEEVSIPHRQDKNMVRYQVLQLVWNFVSIPHRQDKNFLICYKFYIVTMVFPFLIGRIRTLLSLSTLLPPLQFPFLIGRIRTWKSRVLERLSSNRFPFLIGRIRTKKIKKEWYYEKSMFPFLIGRIRTHIANNSISSPKSFHSSQVG